MQQVGWPIGMNINHLKIHEQMRPTRITKAEMAVAKTKLNKLLLENIHNKSREIHAKKG